MEDRQMKTTGIQDIRDLNQRLASCSRVPRRGVFAKAREVLQEQRSVAIRQEIRSLERWLEGRMNFTNYQGPGSEEHQKRQRLAALKAELARLEARPCGCAQTAPAGGDGILLPGQIFDLRL